MQMKFGGRCSVRRLCDEEECRRAAVEMTEGKIVEVAL